MDMFCSLFPIEARTLAISRILLLLDNIPQKSLKTEEEIATKKTVHFPPLFYTVLRYHLSVG